MLNKLFCLHNWDKVQDFYTESIADKSGCSVGEGQDKDFIYKFYEKKHITTFTCNKCGKIKRFVEKKV